MYESYWRGGTPPVRFIHRPGNIGRCSGREQRPMRALSSTVYRKSVELIGSLSAVPCRSQVGSRHAGGCVCTTREAPKRRERGLVTSLAWRACVYVGTSFSHRWFAGHLKHGVGMTSTRGNAGREVIGHHEPLSRERQPGQCHRPRQLHRRAPMGPTVGGVEEAHIELARGSVASAGGIAEYGREGVVDNRKMGSTSRRIPVHAQPGNENIGATRRSAANRAGRDARRRAPGDHIVGGGQQEIIVS